MNAIVLFGDVVRSRRDAPGATAWLRTLAAELEAAYPAAERLAAFGFTQGDELQGLLAPEANPLRAVLRAALHPDGWRMRWVAVAGEVDAGPGPATQRTGPAFLRARGLLAQAAARRDLLLLASGDPWTDRLLDDLAPVLPAVVGELTARQRAVARLLVVEGLRQSEAAERLSVSRATVSVAADRANVRSIDRLARALAELFAAGRRAASATVAAPATGAPAEVRP